MKNFFAVPVVLMTLLSSATYGAKLITASLEQTEHRKPAPQFRLMNAADKPVALSSYTGKVVLLDFWATECGGCKQEIPDFIAMQARHGGDAFTAVGISVDIMYESLKSAAEAWARVKPFAQSVNLNYPILMGDDAVTKTYNLQALPMTLLIDRHGRIAAKYVGIVNAADVEANIESLLQEK